MISHFDACCQSELLSFSISNKKESFPFGHGKKSPKKVVCSITRFLDEVKPCALLSWALEQAAPFHSEQEAACTSSHPKA